MAKRFIKLYEQITAWEWYRHPNTLCLFIYLLLKANYKDLAFCGKTIRRGQIVTSLPKIATDTGLSIQQTRTALAHLISTGEVTDESNPHYRIITVVKYDDYQTATDKSTDNQQTTNRQTNRQSTDNLTASIEYIEQIEKIDKKEQIEERGGRTAQRFTPPTRDEIEIFCLENGLTIDVDRFVDYYTANGWIVGKTKMKDWQATVRNWARRDQGAMQQQRKPAPVRRENSAANFEQRDYSDVNQELMDSTAREVMAFLAAQKEGKA